MKIAIMGAGSMVFTKNLVSDILSFEAMKDVHFSLMDIDRERLELAGTMARSINETRGARAEVTCHDSFAVALDGADYVINTIGVGGFEATKTDFLIPNRYGLQQTISDTLGVGGVFRTLRSLPVVLSMCDEIEKRCPDALLLNYTNPMAMHCLAIQRGTKVKVVGLCHGVRNTKGMITLIARLADMEKKDAMEVLSDWEPTWIKPCKASRLIGEYVRDESVQTLTAGINHMAAFLKFESNGRDLYPLLFKAADDPDLFPLEPVRLTMMKHFGLFLTETSGHLAEYLPYFMQHRTEIKRLNLRPNCYIGTCLDLDATFRQLRETAKAGKPFIKPDTPVSVEYASRIINAMETKTPYEFNGNVNNNGGACISNLPVDSCVEVPCIADADGVTPQRVGALPPQIAALIRTNINVQDLVVQAILERNREHVYHAVMMDPNASSALTLGQIRSMCDDMFAAHGDLMPSYLAG